MKREHLLVHINRHLTIIVKHFDEHMNLVLHKTKIKR